MLSKSPLHLRPNSGARSKASTIRKCRPGGLARSFNPRLDGWFVTIDDVIVVGSGFKGTDS
jgi:hypothetical protein